MSEDYAPNFMLRACPHCSSLTTRERPFWRLARHLKAKGRTAYTLVGCEHARAAFGPADKIHEDPEAMELAEEAWDHLAEQLLAQKTAGWSAAAVDKFTRGLDERSSLPNVTEELGLDLGEMKSRVKPVEPFTYRDRASGEDVTI